MAARLNTRLIAIVALAVVGGGSLIGGFAYLRYRGDATRNVRQGDALMAAGEYSAAFGSYGRAVSKEPANLDYLNKAITALENVVPQTSNDLREKFTAYQTLLEKRVGMAPTRADSHRPVVRLYLLLAALSGAGPESWQRVQEAGRRMYESLAEDDPARLEAQLFRGVGAAGRAQVLEAAQLEEAIADLRAVIAAQPQNDLAHATLARTLLGEGERRLTANRADARGAELLEQGKAAMADAMAKAPDGPLVTDMVLRDLQRRQLASDPTVTPEAIAAAADRSIAALASVQEDWILDRVVAPLLSTADPAIAARAAEALRAHVERSPNTTIPRLAYMVCLAAATKYDEGRAQATHILAAKPLPVGIEAILQTDARVQAATTIFNIEYDRLLRAEPAQRAAIRPDVDKALAQLRGLLDDPDNEPTVIRSEARVAVASERWNEAMAKFEQVVRLLGDSSAAPDLLYEAAVASTRAGESGLARRRLDQAIAQSPRFLDALVLKAELEQEAGNSELARRTIALAKQISPEDPRVVRVGEIVQLSGADALTPVMKTAQDRFDRGDIAGARSMIGDALVKYPNDARLFRAAAFIELSLGENEKAADLARRGLESSPDDEFLKRALLLTTTADPVDRIVKAVESETNEGPERVARTYASLVRAAVLNRTVATERTAAGASDAPDAVARADKLEAAAASYAALAAKLDPPNPIAIRVDFERAVQAGDFAGAQAILDREGGRRDPILGTTERSVMQAQLRLADAERVGATDPARKREVLAETVRGLDGALRTNPESTDLHVLRGQALIRLGNLPEALSSMETAYAQRPSDMNVVESYGAVLQALGEQQRMLEVLRAASRQRDVSPSVRAAWLNAEATMGSRPTALQQRRAAQAAVPDDLGNGVALAALLLTLPPSREMIVDPTGREKFPAERWQTMPVEQQRAALEALRREWLDECSRLLDALAKTHPNAFEIAALRADLARASGRTAQGAERLKAAIDAAGDKATAAMYLVYASFVEALGRPAEFEAAVNEAIKRQGPNREGDRFLGLHHSGKGEWKLAVPRLQAVVEAGGGQRDMLMLAEALARSADYEAAEATLKKATDLYGVDGDVAMLQATILRERLDQAARAGDAAATADLETKLKAAIRRAQEIRPGDPAPLVAEAQAVIAAWQRKPARAPADRELDQALELLERALAQRADYWAAQGLRTQLLVARGEVTKARLELEKFMKNAPLTEEARTALIELWVRQRALDKAIALAREGVALRPLDARPRRALAELLDQAGDVPGAVAEYRRADEMQPGEGLDRYVMLMLKGAPNHAPEYANVVQILSSRPAEMERSIYLAAAYGAALANTGKRAEGIEQLRKAYAAYQQLIVERPDLINGWFDQLWLVFPPDRTAEAEQFVREVSGQKPGPFDLREIALRYAETGPSGLAKAAPLLKQAADAAASSPPIPRAAILFDLGNALYALGQAQEAVPYYEQGLLLNPNNPGILNNLAYVYQVELNDPAKALPLAEQAVALAPGAWEFRDTLGEVLAAAGQHDRAEREFRASLSIAATPGTHIHLATLLAKLGRGPEARAELRKAAELDPKIRDTPGYKAAEAAAGR